MMYLQPKTRSSILTNADNRPTCINHGCNSPVTNSGQRYRPVCSKCYRAGRGLTDYAPGVTPYRTGKCSNEDSHLGFPCPTRWDVVMEHFEGQIHTQLDHKDGDHCNNVPNNVEELCPMCHSKKSRDSGDLSGHRYY